MVAVAPAGARPACIGPSTSVSPYVLPASGAVTVTSLLTVDDQARPDPGVDMVGIPDGLGAYRQGRNLVLLMNHEFVAAAGEVHDHGQTGAFVSRNVIDAVTGRVKETGDLIQDVAYYDYATGAVRRRADERDAAVQPLLLRLAERSRRALRQAQQVRLPGPALLRQRGEPPRGSHLCRHQGRSGHPAAPARPVRVGEHPGRRHRRRRDGGHRNRRQRLGPAADLCR